MTAAIIGCGYVGMAVARFWQHADIAVTATTTTPERLSQLEAIAHQAVVLMGHDADTLRSVLAHQQTVLLSVGAPRADAYTETYLRTAQTLAQVLPQTPSVQQIIYTGSYAVYGDQQGQWVDETAAIAPANQNGEILAQTEQVLLEAATEQRRVCIFRLGGIYGPGRELIKIFGRAAGSTRPGDGSDASNWVHLDDIVGAVEFARCHHLNGIYNLVQDVPLTTKTLLEGVLTQHNLPPVKWNPDQSSDRPYNAKVSNRKLREAGYSFQHPQLQF